MPGLTAAVTALQFASFAESPGCLLAGIGPNLHLYYEGASQPTSTTCVFPRAERIHGFASLPCGRVAVYGGRYLAVVTIAQGVVSVRAVTELNDWIWAVRWVGDRLAVARGYARVDICETENLRAVKRVECVEAELTWSAALLVNDAGILRAASGTSFGDVLLWDVCGAADVRSTATSSPRPAHRLVGHDGPVMRVAFSQNGRFLASASVDRSVRLWRHQSSCECGVAGDCYALVMAHYGHLARVWDVAFLDRGGASVVSVGEDRSCRLWSGAEAGKALAVFHGHDGRNVWSVAVSQTARGVAIATGGEDGVVKVRHIPREAQGETKVKYRGEKITVENDGDALDDLEEERQAPLRIDRGTATVTTEYMLPDRYSNPRKRSSNETESSRALQLIGPDVVAIATDFGRVLVGEMSKDQRYSKREESGGASISWSRLYEDPGGVAFTPNSLVVCDGFMLAGRTNGEVVVLSGVSLPFDASSCEVVQKFAALGPNPCMVMSIFAAAGSGRTDDKKEFDGRGKRAVHAFVASPHGSVHHWMLQRQEPAAVFIGIYQQERSPKSALATSACYVQSCKVLLVGDRGGRILAYEHCESGGDGVTHPRVKCRPHSDRVSSITLISDLQPGGGDGARELLFFTGAFDGRMARVLLVVNTDRSMLIETLSSQKSIERVETIAKVIFPHQGPQTEHGEPKSLNRSALAHQRQCLIGFRSADVVVWDVQQRNEIFRTSCGNWRRPFDIHLSLSAGHGPNDALTLRFVTFAYWRARALHVACVQEPAGLDHLHITSSRLQTLGPGFHGQRANDVVWLPGGTHVLTAGEDTTLHVTCVSRGTEWSTSQVLSQHTSGVACVTVIPTLSTAPLIALSGGAFDVVHLWTSELSAGPWRLLCSTATGTGGARVMSAAGASFRCDCGLNCTWAVVGRSDGLLALLRVHPGGRVEVASVKRAGSSAVLCVASWQDMVLTGDSAGNAATWRVSGHDCENMHIVKERTWKAHEAGVNACDMNEHIAVTGGDDGAVCLWQKGADEGQKHVRHSAAVTGVKILGKVAVSVGADQRISWTGDGEDELMRVGVCDPSALDINAGTVVVAGSGLEVLEGGSAGLKIIC